jgi:hypothetical protein
LASEEKTTQRQSFRTIQPLDSKFETPSGPDPELRKGLNSRERLLLELNDVTPIEDNKLHYPEEPYWSLERKHRYLHQATLLAVFFFGVLLGLCPVYVVH